jgi:general secretion pathway protein H
MSATGRRPGAGEAGYTLVEALTTVAIAAMIGAILFPLTERGIAGAALRQAVSGVRADLTMARAQAMTTGRMVDLVVDGQGRGYGWTPGPQRLLIQGLALAPPGGEVRFYSDGSSSGGTLVLSRGSLGMRFHVSPGTGLLWNAS